MQAGEAIEGIYEREADWDVVIKSDDSPLTQADLASHRVLCEALEKLGEGWPVLSEESDPVDWSVRRRWPTYWLVDPLDGTKEFVGRTGEFTVNVALIHEHEPVMGVVGVPLTHTLYSAVQGKGAERVEKGQRQRIVVAEPASPIRVLASRRSGVGEVDALLDKLASRGLRCERVSAGSSLKFCRIAEGAADFYPRLAPTSEWDTAAAQCVLEAAGGSVMDRAGQPLRYNTKADLLNPFFYAWGGRPDLWCQWLGDAFTRR
ncbi:MAG: 3'(2'),5'-bisphosphate nucleotidase [Gammaproteobacteria bacterium]|nr:MAG: 3'(2'),5'-bisphosphate nucleotidase [Gammaproteobacteria bacterium]